MQEDGCALGGLLVVTICFAHALRAYSFRAYFLRAHFLRDIIPQALRSIYLVVAHAVVNIFLPVVAHIQMVLMVLY